jgi:hypothetical protein
VPERQLYEHQYTCTSGQLIASKPECDNVTQARRTAGSVVECTPLPHMFLAAVPLSSPEISTSTRNQPWASLALHIHPSFQPSESFKGPNVTLSRAHAFQFNCRRFQPCHSQHTLRGGLPIGGLNEVYRLGILFPNGPLHSVIQVPPSSF